MLQTIRAFLKKHKDLILYGLFGGLTTVISFGVSLPLHYLLNMSATLSNLISWICAVLFAFLTNKPFVFQSHDWSLKILIPEFVKFVGCRVGSFFAEELVLFVTVDILLWDFTLLKIVVSVLVVILNYFASRLFVFKKRTKS